MLLTRRQFSKLVVAASPLALVSNRLKSWALPQAAANAAEFDLLVKGGTVIDPSRKLHAPLDVAINNGMVAQVSNDIRSSRARKTLPAIGKIVTPGLINIHDHVYEGVGVGVNADRCCLPKGVTTVVDAGSAGYLTIEEFDKHIIERSDSRVYALIDISGIGLAAGINIVDSQGNLQHVDPQQTIRAIQRHKSSIVGIKVRLSKPVEGQRDIEVLRKAREIANATDIPIMAHIGDSYSPLPELLKLLRKGDIVTHCLNNQPHGLLDAQGEVLPEVWQARKRGVLFDVGAGGSHFSFDVAEKCLKQKFVPDTISSEAACCDLTTTLSKFISLGLTLDQVVELATTRPSQVFNFGTKLGTLGIGAVADIAVFDMIDGKFEFTDSVGERRVGHLRLICNATARAGKLLYW